MTGNVVQCARLELLGSCINSAQVVTLASSVPTVCIRYEYEHVHPDMLICMPRKISHSQLVAAGHTQGGFCTVMCDGSPQQHMQPVQTTAFDTIYTSI